MRMMPNSCFVKIKIKKLCDNATIPRYCSAYASGADIESIEDVELEPGEIKVVRTGIALEIPDGFEAQVRSRSGLAKEGIAVINSPGTIDSDYRGELCVMLVNLGVKTRNIYAHSRIAQLVFSPTFRAEFEPTDKLTDTSRGTGGFGSTGGV
jgi:dUTP pyrophosphatase